MAVAKCFDSAVWNSVEVPLRRFVAVAKRRIRKVVARAKQGEEDRAVAAAFGPQELAVPDSMAKEPAVPGSIAREVVQTVNDAKSRAESQDKDFVNAMRGTVSRVRGACDPGEQSTLQTKLADALAEELRAGDHERDSRWYASRRAIHPNNLPDFAKPPHLLTINESGAIVELATREVDPIRWTLFRFGFMERPGRPSRT